MKAGVLATSYSKIGGARHIFSNDTSLHVLLVGCNVPVERMPTVGNKLPAGTMIKCDSSKQNGGDIHYSFRMYEKSDSGATVKVEKIMGNTFLFSISEYNSRTKFFPTPEKAFPCAVSSYL